MDVPNLWFVVDILITWFRRLGVWEDLKIQSWWDTCPPPALPTDTNEILGRCKTRVSAANSQEISIYFNKYLFGQNKYFLAYFWEENKYILA